MHPDTPQKPLTEMDVRRGMRVNILAGSLGMMWVAVTMGIPLTMFMDAVKASGTQIGLTSTVQLLAMLIQIPTALLAERLARRKPFWAVTVLIQRCLWFVPAFLPLFCAGNYPAMAQIMVILVAISALLGNAGTAPWWSWMTDFVPERLRGSFWGRRQSLVTLANLFAIMGIGYLLDLFPDPGTPGGTFKGFSFVFALAAVVGVADIVIHLWVPEPVPHRAQNRENVLQQILAPLRNRDFRRLTISMGIWMFGIGLISQFGILYLKREYHASYTHLSVITIAASAGVVLAGVMWGYVMDRIGPRNLGIITMLTAPLCGVVWFCMNHTSVNLSFMGLPGLTLPQPIFVLLFVNLIAGMLFSAVGLAHVGLMGVLAPTKGRTVAMAVQWSVIGMLGALGPVLGGSLMDFMESRHLFWDSPLGGTYGYLHVLVLLQMLVTWFGAVPLLYAIRRRPGEIGVRTAFSRLMIGNPLRAAGNIYNIYLLSSATSSEQRATAARRIGAERTAIAAADLIEQLEDPSADVREEAALALGRIGSAEAVDALLRQLQNPDTDLAPQLARALRETRDPKGVDALLQRLKDPDRETVAASARALGEIGEQRAGPPLLELLRRSHDAKVVMATSDALANLGEKAAVYEILPRLTNSRNPILRRSLAVAAGDLLGKPGDLYRILVSTRKAPQVAVSDLLHRILDSVQEAPGERLQKTRRELLSKAQALETACSNALYRDAAAPLFELATKLATLRYGIESGNDTTTAAEALVWYQEHFGIGAWYLDTLRTRLAADAKADTDETEILLGLYLLSNWFAPQKEEATPEPTAGE